MRVLGGPLRRLHEAVWSLRALRALVPQVVAPIDFAYITAEPNATPEKLARDNSLSLCAMILRAVSKCPCAQMTGPRHSGKSQPPCFWGNEQTYRFGWPQQSSTLNEIRLCFVAELGSIAWRRLAWRGIGRWCRTKAKPPITHACSTNVVTRCALVVPTLVPVG